MVPRAMSQRLEDEGFRRRRRRELGVGGDGSAASVMARSRSFSYLAGLMAFVIRQFGGRA